MVQLKDLVQYCDTLLDVSSYQDYCPNGLQVEGRAEVTSIVAGVTASQALIDAAVEQGADALLVHHGFFWKNEAPEVVGMKRRRLKTLLEKDISLLTYHLPLDGHEIYGNNAQLAKLWGLAVEGRFGDSGLGMYASIPETSLDGVAAQVSSTLQREPMVIAGGDHPVKRVGWCSGGAQNYLEAAAALGLDAFISGEISESTVHTARELGIHYLSAGHHATERLGAQALGAHLAEHFSLEYLFIDVSNPV